MGSLIPVVAGVLRTSKPDLKTKGVSGGGGRARIGELVQGARSSASGSKSPRFVLGFRRDKKG